MNAFTCSRCRAALSTGLTQCPSCGLAFPAPVPPLPTILPPARPARRGLFGRKAVAVEAPKRTAGQILDAHQPPYSQEARHELLQLAKLYKDSQSQGFDKGTRARAAFGTLYNYNVVKATQDVQVTQIEQSRQQLVMRAIQLGITVEEFRELAASV